MAGNYVKHGEPERAGIKGQENDYINCVYNRKGLCILSDCPCLKAADKKLLCSSFKEGYNYTKNIIQYMSLCVTQYAEMSEWQTSKIQILVWVTTCGFSSIFRTCILCAQVSFHFFI